MKRCFRISLFKTVFVLFLCVLSKNVLFYALGMVYLFLDRKENILLLLLFFLLFSLFRIIPSDPLRYGIIDHPYRNGYLVDKGLYKIQLFTEEKLSPGDILYFSDQGEGAEDNRKRQLILYTDDSYEKVSSFPLRKVIYEHISSYEPKTASLFKWFFYHLKESDSGLEDVFFFAVYILLSKVLRKNRIIGALLLSVHSLLFCTNCRFAVLFLDLIFSFTSLKRKDICLLEMVLLYCVEPLLLSNTGILLSLLLRLLPQIDLPLKGRETMVLIQSLFFHKVTLCTLYLFSYFRNIYLFFLLFSYAVLLFPVLEGPYLFLWNVFEAISAFLMRFSIKGSYTLVSLLFFLLLRSIRFTKKIPNILILFFLLLPVFHHPFCEVSFLNVGQGDAILIRSSFGLSNILIDTGPPYSYSALKRELDKRGIYSIDHLIITHDDDDHNGNLISLEKDYRIKDVIEKGRDIDGPLKMSYLDKDAYDNDNDNSLVYYLEIDGVSFLFTGDISKNAERELIDRYGDLSVSILKVSHHGSYTGTSPYFISRILPEEAVISTSGRYGHPHKSTLKTLEKYKVEILSTAQRGSIRYLFLRGFHLRSDDREWYNILV